MDNYIAVLLTCHNRRKKTIASLNALFSSTLPVNYKLKVFLVDDGSTDGTSIEVKKRFPKVNIIQGTGNLYWNQGMRLAWSTAIQNNNYNFFLWLNDDTMLARFALRELFECYNEVLSKTDTHAIITGACKSSYESNEFSYGGKTDNGPVIPNGILQQCKYINGNVVLIPKVIYKKIGILSSDYTHTMGDFDYGLRAAKEGYSCFTTKHYIAICSSNQENSKWCNPNTPLKERIKLLYSPKGLNIKEYNIFRQKFWGWRWIIFAAKAYIRTIFPKIYSKIQKR